MPIYGKSPEVCYEVFYRHLGSLLTDVFGPRTYFDLSIQGEAAQVSIWQGDDKTTVPVETSEHGTLQFCAYQQLTTRPTTDDEKEYGKFRLRTVAYGYGLTEEVGLMAKALLRREFVKVEGQHDGHAIHHQHARTDVPCKDGSRLDLDKLHLPSGWISIESVIRFLIHDLGMHPACGGDDAWPELLHNSEKAFSDNFQGRVAEPPKKKSKKNSKK